MTGQDAGDHGDGPILSRLLAFSDGTFAIGLTLLVLELRPPGSPEAVSALIPKVIAFAGTFAVVSIFWLAHMSYMRRLRVFDWTTAVINLVLLFWIALTPFASATLGDYGGHPYAWYIYGGVMIGASLSQALLWLVVSRDKGRLIGGVTWRERGFRTLRALSPGLAFAAGVVALRAGRIDLAPLSPLLILPIMLLSGVVFGSRHPRPAARQDAG